MLKAIDFFCGAGGLTRGLLDAGIKVLAGVDLDVRLKETYERNNAPSKFVSADIRDIDILSLRKNLGIADSDAVLYAACTPCQPFSTLNQMKGKDDRKGLLLSFAALVERMPPDFILVENVPGLNTAYGREIYESFMKTLRSCGFDWSVSDFVDAQDYNVPQVRKRFILLASRHGVIALPPKVPRDKAALKHHIKKYPAINDGEKNDQYFNHVARKLPLQHKRIVEAVPEDGGSRKDVSDKSILLKCHQERPDVHKDVFGRMSWDKPAPTLTCRCTDVYCGRFIHPSQNRGISLREAAAIQNFPDDYVFYGTFFHIARQIGNAVPVNLAKALGVSIVEASGLVGGAT